VLREFWSLLLLHDQEVEQWEMEWTVADVRSRDDQVVHSPWFHRAAIRCAPAIHL
jgi:hypothetical protein